MLLKLAFSLQWSLHRSPNILRFLLGAAIGRPRLSIAIALLTLAALAATMSYTGFLVVGMLADYLGTSRWVAGLLLGGLFARFPWIRRGKPRMVGLVPKPMRRPLMASLLALCLLRGLTQGDTVSALVIGFTMAFVLGFPWLKSLLFARLSQSMPGFAARRDARAGRDDSVIEGEFRERKE